ncbi:MAG: MOSC domain-containing protein [Burkholderiaceae bacterium]|nr:MOSC domain-containing protein [Microbacteriaceae bacterium]
MSAPAVVSVSRDDAHRFSKPTADTITLIAGFGVAGDAHAGATTQHRYLAAKEPSTPNLTQVHLIPVELFSDLGRRGFAVGSGELGENVTTRGLVLETLPLGTRLHLGETAIIELTGLRSPCSLINRFQRGLMKTMIDRDGAGQVVRRAGVMGIVLAGGELRASDPIRVELPAGAPVPLGVV